VQELPSGKERASHPIRRMAAGNQSFGFFSEGKLEGMLTLGDVHKAIYLANITGALK
jgi:hypothetical protein